MDYGSRRKVHDGDGGIAAGGKHRKLRDHSFNRKHRAGKVNRKWGKAINLQNPAPVTYFFLQGFIS